MTRASLLTISALTLSAVLSGCGGGPTATASADPDRARQVLRDALDAWKKGDPHASPSTQTPDLRVADEDWLAGAKLVSYQISPGDEPLGARRRCPVVLTLSGRKGKPQTKTVHYDVATDPAPSVIRLD